MLIQQDKREKLPKSGPQSPQAWTPGRIACICTEELIDEIEGWMTTAWHFARTPLAVVGDYPVVAEVRRVAKEYKIPAQGWPWLAGDGRKVAEEHLGNVVSHSRYWKESVIWWKCRGLVKLMTDIYPEEGILLTDSDIVFMRPFQMVFYADVVLSPFYWAPGMVDAKGKPLRNAHGVHNAGYLATNKVEAAQKWLRWFEKGEGGFYEQGCLDFFDRNFDCEYFDRRHNFGKWRRLSPDDRTISVHYHLAETPRKPWCVEAQARAKVARETAKRELLKLNDDL